MKSHKPGSYGIYVFCDDFPMRPGFVERGCPDGECQDSDGAWDYDSLLFGHKGVSSLCASHAARPGFHLIAVDLGAKRVILEIKTTIDLPAGWHDEENA